jgi:hypothetical protein
MSYCADLKWDAVAYHAAAFFFFVVGLHWHLLLRAPLTDPSNLQEERCRISNIAPYAARTRKI